MNPPVGTVLWERDGNVETPHRGELRDGDRAGYTVTADAESLRSALVAEAREAINLPFLFLCIEYRKLKGRLVIGKS